jgi:hypothetical protein
MVRRGIVTHSHIHTFTHSSPTSKHHTSTLYVTYIVLFRTLTLYLIQPQTPYSL